MVKAIYFGLFVMLSWGIIAQETENGEYNKLDQHGRKQGFWKVFDNSGALRYEGSFINDHPVDTFIYYYPDGRVKAISVMLEQGRRSETQFYHLNGRLMGEGNFLEQQKDSTWRYYSDLDGTLLSVEFYRNGKLDSNVMNYYPEGEVAEKIPYSNGIKEGKWTQYFPDGKLKLKATYKNDLLEGIMLVYYQNGMVQISGNYKHNFKDGLWIHFDERGEVIKKEIYKNGQLKESEEF